MRALLSPFLAAAAIAAPLPAPAEVPFDVARLEVLPGWRQADGTHVAGLRIVLADGWKTYWRSPGDGGIPPRLALEASGNVEGLRLSWPVPEVFDQNGLRSIGYAGEVVLPVAVRPGDAGAPIRLEGEIEIGVCEDICIPMTFPISALLPPVGSRDPVLRAALADRPMTGAEAGVGAVGCDISPIADGLAVTARVDMPPLGANEVAVLELPDRTVWISEADMRRTGGTLEATVDMVPETAAPFALDRSEIRITVLAEGRAVDIRGCR